MNDVYELSIVVPAYNEQRSLPILIDRYREAGQKMRLQLVVVDNGSTDGTAACLTGLMRDPQYRLLKVVTVPRNQGYGHGIWQGLAHCDAPVVGWSHADLQCAPEDCIKAYQLYCADGRGCLVKGHRQGRNWKALVLTFGLACVASVVLLRRFDDINGQPKVFPRKLLALCTVPPKGFSFDLYMQYVAIRSRVCVIGFPVRFEQRVHGLSKWATTTLSKMRTIRSFLVDVMQMRLGRLR